MTKPQSLFRLYQASRIPTEKGFIITSNYDPEGGMYTVLELISYANVKEIISDGESLTFRSDGYKLYIIVEPASYIKRQVEPVFRDQGKSVPYRFNEMMIFKDSKNNRIMVGEQPIVTLTSFSIDSPEGDNFSVYIHRDLQVRKTMKTFLTQIFNKDLSLFLDISRQASNFATEIMVRTIKV